MFGWLKGKKSGKEAEAFPLDVPEGNTLVVFVCTANLSRSPMAEAMFRHEVQEWPEITVASCGTKSVPGFSPTPEALTVLQTHGYSTDGLVTHKISSAYVDRANYIFVMGDVHLKTILQRYPNARGKVYLARDFSPDEAERGLDVPDPHEKPLDAYLEVYAQLQVLVPLLGDFVIDGPSDEWKHWYEFYRQSHHAIGR